MSTVPRCKIGLVDVQETRWHNKELQEQGILLFSMENVVHMRERRGANKILVGKPVGKRPLGRPKRRWEDNIKMDLQVVGWGHEVD